MKFVNPFPQNAVAVFSILLILSVAFPRVALAQIGSDDLLPDGRKSDGCTLIGGDEFKPCCVVHDREYFFGGTVKERRKADNRLFKCIRERKTLGARLAAPFIWLGVRIGGLPFLPTPFRWGFGKRSKVEKTNEAVQPEPTPSPTPQLP